MSSRFDIYWVVLSTKIDSLSFRERIFLFLSILFCVIAFIYRIWLSPQQVDANRMDAQIKQKAVDLAAVKFELKNAHGSITHATDAKNALNAQLLDVSAKLSQANQKIAASTLNGVSPESLGEILVRLLENEPGLTLLGLASTDAGSAARESSRLNLAATALTSSPRPMPMPMPAPELEMQPRADNSLPNPRLTNAPPAPPEPAGITASRLPGALPHQVIELTVSGPYPQLMAYTKTLEKSLPQVRWGTMTIKSSTSTPEMTLQIILLGASS